MSDFLTDEEMQKLEQSSPDFIPDDVMEGLLSGERKAMTHFENPNAGASRQDQISEYLSKKLSAKGSPSYYSGFPMQSNDMRSASSGAAEGMTLGHSAELAAGAGEVAERIGLVDPIDFDKRLEYANRFNKQERDRDPAAYDVGELTGGVAIPVGSLAKASKLRQGAAAVGAGAAYGSGISQGEIGSNEHLRDTAFGGLLGGLGFGAAEGLSTVLKSDALKNYLTGKSDKWRETAKDSAMDAVFSNNNSAALKKLIKDKQLENVADSILDNDVIRPFGHKGDYYDDILAKREAVGSRIGQYADEVDAITMQQNPFLDAPENVSGQRVANRLREYLKNQDLIREDGSPAPGFSDVVEATQSLADEFERDGWRGMKQAQRMKDNYKKYFKRADPSAGDKAKMEAWQAIDDEMTDAVERYMEKGGDYEKIVDSARSKINDEYNNINSLSEDFAEDLRNRVGAGELEITGIPQRLYYDVHKTKASLGARKFDEKPPYHYYDNYDEAQDIINRNKRQDSLRIDRLSDPKYGKPINDPEFKKEPIKTLEKMVADLERQQAMVDESANVTSIAGNKKIPELRRLKSSLESFKRNKAIIEAAIKDRQKLKPEIDKLLAGESTIQKLNDRIKILEDSLDQALEIQNAANILQDYSQELYEMTEGMPVFKNATTDRFGSLEDYLKSKRDYRNLKYMEEPALRAQMQAKNNNSFSLNEYILGSNMAGGLSGVAGYAASQGNPMTAAVSAGAGILGAGALMGGRRFLRNRGSSMAAYGANEISKILAETPQVLGKFANTLQQAASQGPQRLGVAHHLLYKNNPEYRAIFSADNQSSEDPEYLLDQ